MKLIILMLLVGCGGVPLSKREVLSPIIKKQKRPVSIRPFSVDPGLSKKSTDLQMVFSEGEDGLKVKEKRPRQKKVPPIVRAPKRKTQILQNTRRISSSIKRSHLKKGPQLTLAYPEKLFKFWVNYFSKREAKRFKTYLKNGSKFIDVIHSVYEKHGLPKDLFFVGLIESGYFSKIKSRASAVGPWQFIKGTATRYGLRVDAHVDERYNIYKSTEAAAQYFKDLYNIFGSWELALCAYNAGEYRIIGAIRKGNSRDYKTLVKKNLIPKETIYYIPKVAAARYLAGKMGISKWGDPALTRKYNQAIPVVFKGPFNIDRIASSVGLSPSELRLLNPDVKLKWTPLKKRRSFKLFFPYAKKRRAELLSRNWKQLPKRIVKKKRSLKRKRNKIVHDFRYHKVKRGESLYLISRKYNVPIKTIMKWNSLRRKTIRIDQRLRVSKVKIYRVRRGDNLHKIARKFNTSIYRIVKFNSLKSKKIFPRQKLQIPI